MTKIVTFGEIMMRLSPKNHERFIQSDTVDVHYGGAEANVAISLAQFGQTVTFVSKVPDHALGEAAINHLRRFGVKTDHMVRGGERLGLYYLEPGTSVRPSRVIYDRKRSAITQASADDFDWDAIFKDTAWFHWSGITPAISDKAAGLTLKACKAAKKYGATVSVDLNYRSKLWSREKARNVLRPLMEYVDVCIGNENDVRTILGGSEASNHAAFDFNGMVKTYDFKWLATTIREGRSASRNLWQAVVYNAQETFKSPRYDIDAIVDRVGGGDAFSAGFIQGMLQGMHVKDTLAFATAAGALKQTIPGDQNLTSTEEIEVLLEGDASGKVQR